MISAAQFTGINALFGVPIVLMSDSVAELFSRATLLAAFSAGLWCVIVVLMRTQKP